MNILILARHYPPAVSGGSRRPYLLAKGLRALGHQVFVMAPTLPQGETGLVVDHPSASPNLSIATEPSRREWFLRTWGRELLLWPDPDRRWANRVIKAFDATLNNTQFDCIISTSPPESIHHAGYKISKRLNARWIGDFRDNWLDNPLNPQKNHLYRKIIERRIARHWLKSMTLAVAPTQAILQELQSLYPKTKKLLLSQISEMPKPRQKKTGVSGWDTLPKGSLRVLHIGSFSLSDPERNIQQTLDQFAAEASPETYLCLAGSLTSEEIDALNATSNVVWLGILERGLALSLTLEADALLLAASNGTRAVPGKLSEYEQAMRPIISVGEGPWREAINSSSLTTFSELQGGVALEPPLIDQLSPEALADRLMEAIQSESF